MLSAQQNTQSIQNNHHHMVQPIQNNHDHMNFKWVQLKILAELVYPSRHFFYFSHTSILFSPAPCTAGYKTDPKGQVRKLKVFSLLPNKCNRSLTFGTTIQCCWFSRTTHPQCRATRTKVITKDNFFSLVPRQRGRILFPLYLPWVWSSSLILQTLINHT